MVEEIAGLLGQVSVETARLQAVLPYATPAMSNMALQVLEGQKGLLDPQKLQWLTLDEGSVPLTHEQRLQLHTMRAQWIGVAQEHLKTLRMAADSIVQQFQMMQQFQLDMQRQFTEFLKRQW